MTYKYHLQHRAEVEMRWDWLPLCIHLCWMKIVGGSERCPNWHGFQWSHLNYRCGAVLMGIRPSLNDPFDADVAQIKRMKFMLRSTRYIFLYISFYFQSTGSRNKATRTVFRTALSECKQNSLKERKHHPAECSQSAKAEWLNDVETAANRKGNIKYPPGTASLSRPPPAALRRPIPIST